MFRDATVGQVRRVAQDLAHSVGDWTARGYDNIATSLRDMLSSGQNQNLGTNEARVLRTRVQQGMQRDAQNAWKERNGDEDEHDSDHERMEEDEEMLDDGPTGAGGLGGNLPRKSMDKNFMTTMENRRWGPGWMPVENTKRMYTFETPRMTSEDIEIEEGQFYNLLAQEFNVPGAFLAGFEHTTTDAPSDGTLSLTKIWKPPAANEVGEWVYQVGSRKKNNFCYISLFNSKAEKPADEDAIKKPLDSTHWWTGYVNGRGHEEGTYGAVPVNLARNLQRNIVQFPPEIRKYKFARIVKEEFRFTDMYAWSVNQSGSNLTHALTPDIGTILEIPIKHIAECRVLDNAGIQRDLTDATITETPGIVTSYDRRATQAPNLRVMVHDKYPKPEYQTGWTGGNYNKTLTATKQHWFPNINSTLDWKPQLAEHYTAAQVGFQVAPTKWSAQWPIYNQGKPGLFLKTKDDSYNLDIESNTMYTMHDMDTVLPDGSEAVLYAPFTPATTIHTQKWLNISKVLPDSSSKQGGLGIGPDIDKMPMLYIRRKMPAAEMKQFLKYSLQIRTTWEFADAIDDGNDYNTNTWATYDQY